VALKWRRLLVGYVKEFKRLSKIYYCCPIKLFEVSKN